MHDMVIHYTQRMKKWPQNTFCIATVLGCVRPLLVGELKGSCTLSNKHFMYLPILGNESPPNRTGDEAT